MTALDSTDPVSTRPSKSPWSTAVLILLMISSVSTSADGKVVTVDFTLKHFLVDFEASSHSVSIASISTETSSCLISTALSIPPIVSLYAASTSSAVVTPPSLVSWSKTPFVTEVEDGPLVMIAPVTSGVFSTSPAKMPAAIADSILLRISFGSTPELGVTVTVDLTLKHFFADTFAAHSASTTSTTTFTSSAATSASFRIDWIASSYADLTSPAVAAAFASIAALEIDVADRAGTEMAVPVEPATDSTLSSNLPAMMAFSIF
mmetsp:Transcript_6847/g.13387  ORF Transcript_6847/g.13387 Transcript_6847/m.13387 type:complete len:263 (+) Transcript_6847:3250-4038(+)